MDTSNVYICDESGRGGCVQGDVEKIKYVRLSSGAEVVATRVISGIADLETVLARADGQELLRDLQLIASGRADQVSGANVRILKDMDLLSEKEGELLRSLGEIVKAALKGEYPKIQLDEEPYELSSKNQEAMSWAVRYSSDLLGLTFPSPTGRSEPS